LFSASARIKKANLDKKDFRSTHSIRNVGADGWVEAPQKTNLDKTDSQPSPFDKLRAGSAGLIAICPES
jgi:hypothetical protein